MTVIDTAHLRALAEAATPGPWDAHRFDEICGSFRWQFQSGCGPVVGYTNDDLDNPKAKHDAAHIAANHPAAVIAMCDEIDEQGGEIEAAQTSLNRAGCTPAMWEGGLMLDEGIEMLIRDRDTAIARAEKAEAQVEALREALREALAGSPPEVDPCHWPAVEALCGEIGYGVVISTAAALWRGITPGGEFFVGPCQATVDAILADTAAAESRRA